MKWNNANTDLYPNNKDKVLISVNGIYYDAVYDATTLEFVPLRYDYLTFKTSQHQIYWCPIAEITN